MRAGPRILLTGSTGCVGRYIVDELLAQHDCTLLLLVRDPARLPRALRDDDRVSVLSGDLVRSQIPIEVLSTIDVAVLAATSWGPEPEASRVNVAATLDLTRRLADLRCRHIIHFATASLLDFDHAPLPEAESLGTPYIRSKAECAKALREGAGRPLPRTILYPTLVVGGGEHGIPRSHLCSLLQVVAAHRRLLQLVRADGSFHAIHAADIAAVVSKLVAEAPPAGEVREFVLGGCLTTVNEALSVLCGTLALRRVPLIPLTRLMAEALIRLFKVELAPWDRFCLSRGHFGHRHPMMPQDLGASAAYPTFASLADFALRLAPSPG
jgi:nucleoside-diphosphate-sugar epimerase